jgi:hypothetical protein
MLLFTHARMQTGTYARVRTHMYTHTHVAPKTNNIFYSRRYVVAWSTFRQFLRCMFK